MRTLIVLLGLAAVSVTPAYSTDGVPKFQRIVGGTITSISQYPEMAALLFSTSGAGHRQECGGTILNNRVILTAAHCVHGRANNNVRLRLGSTNANSRGTVLHTQRIILHPDSNKDFDNDIAMIHTTTTIPFSANVRAGMIAGSNYNLADNQVVWAAGWGLIYQGGPSSEQLRHVQVWSISQNICRQRYAAMDIEITDNMLCSGWLDVGGRDQCQGDSGGPLFHNGVLVGVCSFGQGCGHSNFPGVNVRVSRYTNWISQNA